ncbi:MAG: YgiT-type zinc finger protein [Clostridiales bacterium]|nr:YgiT-type zinc finger protein [Clostridiales bacterium]
MTCCFCNGEMGEKKLAYMAELEDCLMLVKNVPSMECSICGEVSYDNSTMARLGVIADSIAREGGVVVVDFA